MNPRNAMLLHDATQGLKTLPDHYLDLIVTDPAYDSLEKWRAMGTTTRLKESKSSSNSWFPVVDKDYFHEFLSQCYRTLKRNTHLYVMCDDEMSYYLRPMIEEAGFDYRKKIIWHKVGKEEDVTCPKCGSHVTTRVRPGAPGMGYPFRSCYEVILLAQKGKRRMPDDRGVRDVLKFPYPGDLEDPTNDFTGFDLIDTFEDVLEFTREKGKGVYPTQKPLGLLETFIRQSSEPGDLVCDPFAGSGSTLLAARNQGRDYLGFDLTEKAIRWFEAVRDTGQPPPEATEDNEGCEHETKDVNTILDMFGAES